MTLAPLHLISAHPWRRVTFTTYALSLSFFEAVILDALIRGGGRQALILADVNGVRASLSEQGAQRVGKDYEVEPVAVSSGIFHPKISVLSGAEDCHLLVGSGNLTFGGWGGNLEVLEHLHPSFAADAFGDAADFFELLSVTERVRHGAQAQCDVTAADLRSAIEGKPHTGNIRLFHNLDRSISEQLRDTVAELGGATRLVAAAPFWDQGGAIDGLCAALGLEDVSIHAHRFGTVEGTAGSNWPAACRSAVHPIRLKVMDDEQGRRLHAKAFEIMCKRGRVLVSGSANSTGAALDRGHNIEACVVRMQRDRTVGWTFVACEAPEPRAALEADTDEEEERRGLLRAVLDGDELNGEILTPAMRGTVSVFHVSSAGQDLLGKTTLSADFRFQVNTPALEQKSWLPGRLVIRVEDGRGRQADGFVSVASFADVTRRAGMVGRRLLAVLAGTETPADIAAIMSWFHEDPRRLADAVPPGTGGGNGPTAAEEPASTVVVADLSSAAVAAVAVVVAASAGGEHDGGRKWSRFMDQILAAFRQKRGPFGRASGAGTGDDDRDDHGDADDGDDRDNGDGTSGQDDDPAIQRSLANFEKLFEILLKPGIEARHAIIAFDLAQYICERLQPDAAQVMKWLKQLVAALLDRGVPPERLQDVAGAILTVVGTSAERSGPRWARGCLLRLGSDLLGSPPSGEGVQGFQSVLTQSKTLPELWSELQAVRTFPEQVRSYLEVLGGRVCSGEFPDIPRAAEEEWPVMEAALESNNRSKTIVVCENFPDICPEHHLGLPTSEVGKLQSVGIATVKNCCRKILVWTGGS